MTDSIDHFLSHQWACIQHLLWVCFKLGFIELYVDVQLCEKVVKFSSVAGICVWLLHLWYKKYINSSWSCLFSDRVCSAQHSVYEVKTFKVLCSTDSMIWINIEFMLEIVCLGLRVSAYHIDRVDVQVLISQLITWVECVLFIRDWSVSI